MKQTQLAIAAALLAAMVFVVTFAMNYLGGGASSSKGPEPDRPRIELTFAHNAFPNDPTPLSSIEREEKSTGHQDFWFCNTNAKPVKVGLASKNCKCTNVEVFVLPADASARLVSDVKSIDGPEALAKQVDPAAAGRSDVEKGATRVALDKEADHADVPVGGVGWVRLNYKGEKPGRQLVTAVMWMDVPRAGPTATLQLALTFHEAFRAQVSLSFGTLRDEDLTRGVTRYLLCYSSTRKALKLEATAARSKGDAASDPLEVGQPVLLDDQERAMVQKSLEQPGSELVGDSPGAKVVCAYKIPVTVKAVSADGKTPIDLGPFRRRLLISSPDIEGEPKAAVVTGRVRGLIEVGSDEEGADLNFGGFPRLTGRRQKLPLHSETPGVKLEVDPSRMPAFLKASLTPVEGRSAWTLNVEVVPGMASGPFPRKDPLYEDSAVYLKATVPGKPPRSLRIGVSGTATEG